VIVTSSDEQRMQWLAEVQELMQDTFPKISSVAGQSFFHSSIRILGSGERMDIADCVKFANENPVTYIATAEGDQPRVRAFAMWFADNTGFYHHTGTPKSVCQQLRKNPKVELCFYAPGAQGTGRMMRVCGKVEFLEDKSL